MTRVRKDPVERRQEFIDIAMELFCTKGYVQTMVQDICKVAGVAKGTFFYYFPTKDDVLKAIFDDWTRAFVEEFIRRARGLDAVSQLRLLLQMSARENSIEPLMDKLWEEHQRELVMQVWQRMVIANFNPMLRQIFPKGNEEGTMHVQHVEESLDFFWSLLDALWPDDKKDIMTDDSLRIREKIAGNLMEQLLGMEAGSLAHFDDAD